MTAGHEDEYGKKQARSLDADDLTLINEVYFKAKQIGSKVVDGVLTVCDSNGENLAEIWWDGESEDWLVDIVIGR
jgi:hypothetical protein